MPGRQSRRSVLAAITALPLTGALSACSGNDSASQSTSKSGTKGKTTITFWSALRGSQEVVDAFNKTHDTIQVAFEQIPSGTSGGYLKLSNAARAGNAPDVATIEYPQVPGYAIDGVARDITDVISDKLKAKLLPQALGLTTFEGRTYSVPLDVEPMVLHYRKDLFDKYGFEVPTTWDEYTDLARAVRRTGGKRRATFFSTDMGQFSGWCWGPVRTGSTPRRAPGTCRSPTPPRAASASTGSGSSTRTSSTSIPPTVARRTPRSATVSS